ncbi:hypothetical protein M422DRAFT_65700 [Sphaerobolus stellatus SS14]|nr:hypothetical protein M422DRAFT_65700 [Sphaerobolus stellatus SS14]
MFRQVQTTTENASFLYDRTTFSNAISEFEKGAAIYSSTPSVGEPFFDCHAFGNQSSAFIPDFEAENHQWSKPASDTSMLNVISPLEEAAQILARTIFDASAMELPPSYTAMNEDEPSGHHILPLEQEVLPLQSVSWTIITEESNNETQKFFKCSVVDCGKLCQTMENAEKHQSSHNRVKRYACICGQQFATMPNAQRHLKTLGRKHQCPHCHRNYARKDYLHVHQKLCSNGRRTT